MQNKLSARTEPTEFKQMWKSWLETTLGEAGKRVESVQNCYKRDYDKRRCRDTEEIFPKHYFFLRSEEKDDKDHLHKIAPIAEGPFIVKSVDTYAKTLFIVRNDKIVENVSRLRVILGPDEPTADGLRENTPPMTLNEIIGDYPISESENLAQARPCLPTEFLIPAKAAQDLVIDADQPKSEENTTNKEEPVTKQLEDILSDEELEKDPQNLSDDDGNAKEDRSDDFDIDKSFSHQINRSRNHKYTKYGETSTSYDGPRTRPPRIRRNPSPTHKPEPRYQLLQPPEASASRRHRESARF